MRLCAPLLPLSLPIFFFCAYPTCLPIETEPTNPLRRAFSRPVVKGKGAIVERVYLVGQSPYSETIRQPRGKGREKIQGSEFGRPDAKSRTFFPRELQTNLYERVRHVTAKLSSSRNSKADGGANRTSAEFSEMSIVRHRWDLSIALRTFRVDNASSEVAFTNRSRRE